MGLFFKKTEEEKYLKFKPSSIGAGFAIVAFNGGVSTVNIPETYKNKPVVEIASGIFKFSKINKINIPGTIITIGAGAFDGCTNLTTVNYGGTVKQWNEINFADQKANPLSNCADLYCQGDMVTEVDFSTVTTEISNYAFTNCTSIEKVILGVNVKKIGAKAFYNVQDVSEVYYGGSADEWAKIAFVDEYSNPLLDGAKLYLNGELATTIELGRETSSVSAYAFAGCTSLENVILMEDIASIGESAFRNCNLVNLAILSRDVDKNALFDINSVENVDYLGDEEEWNDNSFNTIDCFFNANVDFDCEYEMKDSEDGESSVLVKINKYSKILEFELIDKPCVYKGKNYDNQYRIENCLDDAITFIEIPEFYNGYPVTRLGGPKYLTRPVFKNCHSLADIVLPDSVTSIGAEVFKNTAIYRNDDNWKEGMLYIGKFAIDAVDSCDKVLAGTEYIADNAFANNMGLSSISIPNTVKRIGNYAFTGCYNLYSVYFGGTQEEWCNIIFDDETSSNPLYGHGPLYFNNQELTELVIKEGTVEVDSRFCRCNSIEKVVLPSSVKVLLEEAFSNCRNLKEINIPYGVTTIGACAFSDTGLESIDIPDTVTEIGNQAFSQSNITEITIPYGITKISDYMFQGCEELTKVVLPNTITYIGSNAFDDCEKLTDINIPNNLQFVGYKAFDNSGILLDENNWTNEALYLGGGLIRVKSDVKGVYEVKGDVNFVASTAFNECEVEEVILPNGITYVSGYTFLECMNLKKVVIPESVTKIDGYAFYNCKNLEEVNIPFAVKSIGENAFKNAGFLTNKDNYVNGTLYVDNCLIKVSAEKAGLCIVDSSVRCMTLDAFEGCENLVEIEINCNMEEVIFGTFYGCKKLEVITLPRTVKKINLCTNCLDNLKVVNFSGSKDEWDKIEKDNSDFDNIKVNFRY